MSLEGKKVVETWKEAIIKSDVKHCLDSTTSDKTQEIH